jgi:hypothetical protein
MTIPYRVHDSEYSAHKHSKMVYVTNISMPYDISKYLIFFIPKLMSSCIDISVLGLWCLMPFSRNVAVKGLI